MILNPNLFIHGGYIISGGVVRLAIERKIYRLHAYAIKVTIVLMLLYKVIYRIFFHPLRSVPGPWLNKISEFPAAFNLLRGNQHIYYMRLHRDYGSVVRVSPSEVSFISTEAREEIYGHRVRDIVLLIDEFTNS
jgi:hypothetical protein